MNPQQTEKNKDRSQIKKILVDSSSLILLYKAGLLAEAHHWYKLLVVQSVMQEVSRQGKPGAETFKAKHLSGELTILPIQERSRCSSNDTNRLNGMGAGERETLVSFFYGNGDFILVDDLRAIQFCSDKGYPFINTLLLPRVLMLAGNMDKERSREMFHTVQELGRYSPGIVQKAMELDSQSLQRFFP